MLITTRIKGNLYAPILQLSLFKLKLHLCIAAGVYDLNLFAVTVSRALMFLLLLLLRLLMPIQFVRIVNVIFFIRSVSLSITAVDVAFGVRLSLLCSIFFYRKAFHIDFYLNRWMSFDSGEMPSNRHPTRGTHLCVCECIAIANNKKNDIIKRNAQNISTIGVADRATNTIVVYSVC